MKVNTLTLEGTELKDVLAQTPPLPAQLYWIGDDLEQLLEMPKVGIIGSRRATPYGRFVTDKLAAELAGHGVVIVSGMAIGLDSVAHSAALRRRGKTIAVLPAGLDRIYPASNRGLARQILRNGALVTEYPLGTGARKYHFIARNRILAALCDVLVVTEGSDSRTSGSLHTANFALEQGKTVAAVPGNIDLLNSGGPNRLIKQGAQLISETADVLQLLGINPERKKALAGLTTEESAIVGLLEQSPQDVAQLQYQLSIDSSLLLSQLTTLEIRGIIASQGGIWRIN